MRVRQTTDGIAFKCPGCKDTHAIPTGLNGWTWNGSLDAPTISPSIDVKAGHHASAWKPGDACWCTYNETHESPFVCYHCHSVITDGRIAFGTDSTHELAGQTVELPSID